MPKFTGRRIAVGFGKESVRGTAVAPSYWFPRVDLDFDEKMEVVENEASIGVLIDAQDTEVVRRYAEGPISAPIGVNGMSLLLYALFGSVATTTDSVGAYKHSFTLANTNQRPSLTVSMFDPVAPYKFAMGTVKKVKLKYEQNKFIDLSIDFIANKGASDGTLTPNFTQEYFLAGKHANIFIADLIGGLDAGTQLNVRTLDIEIDLKTEEEYCLGSTSPVDFLNTLVSVSGSIETTYQNETELKNLALNGTTKALRIKAINNDVTIGVSSKPTFNIDLGKIKFTEWTKKKGNNEVVTQTCKLKYLGNGTDILSYLVNTTPTI